MPAQSERQASAQEIVDSDVDSAMIAAGMRAHDGFMALPEARRAMLGRAQMVAGIYGAMEATRRRAMSGSPARQLSDV
jgi:hypothetical protein